ncbi:MAG: hypothetical protein DMF44_10525 [Verrucomicrobia bacterium]|nr:MAG: hypothetical protein DMF05_08160 [Verrucomicrobiota bacterium]PYL22580.1 MAG: hypothetical protein DMF44_10525 [Verrucomicrobiota bacterium]
MGSGHLHPYDRFVATDRTVAAR